MRTLILITTILILSGCQIIEKYSQCEKDNNYTHVNNELFDEYKKNYDNGNIKSYYFDIDRECKRDSCFYAYKNLDFFEYNFNNNKFKGVYRVDILKSSNNEKCYYKKFNKDNVCYLMTKIDKPISRYHIFMTSKDKSHYEEFKDSYANNYILKYNYQVYSEMNISGAPSGGFCPSSYRKGDYKLDLFSIPYL